jgi:hypothetical protein
MRCARDGPSDHLLPHFAVSDSQFLETPNRFSRCRNLPTVIARLGRSAYQSLPAKYIEVFAFRCY